MDQRQEPSESQLTGNMSEKTVGGIAEHIPLVTIVVLISGYFNIHSYYPSFGISIYNYLDPSEIVFSFSSIAFELLVAALFVRKLYVF